MPKWNREKKLITKLVTKMVRNEKMDIFDKFNHEMMK